ncbi:hypothetical protein JRQ81_011529 [Phrynocephalus forsythii]|uniref:Mediator of RNA polymerase II transcription subunit 29 n=2 Tax=Bifurcata TaxID=1329961 RepID=A0A9Q0X619_9SAUR|nr:hypothetical protein JRQ81_011529 [Phrynocephalus forsythii]
MQSHLKGWRGFFDIFAFVGCCCLDEASRGMGILLLLVEKKRLQPGVYRTFCLEMIGGRGAVLRSDEQEKRAWSGERLCSNPLLWYENLMKVAAQNFLQNTNIDSGQKSNDGPVQRVDKSLEEFYALCDQLELCLRLAYECLSQSFDSAKHSPTLVPTATKPDAVQTESLPYTQYLSMIKSQIACAKDIHNALLECSNKITGKVPSQGVL